MANSKKKSTKPKSPTLKNQIKSLNDELKDEKDKFLRLFAEFENFRKRTAKERLDLFKSASSELMTALIPVADDMDRAFAEFKKSENENLIKGFELIYNKLNVYEYSLDIILQYNNILILNKKLTLLLYYV